MDRRHFARNLALGTTAALPVAALAQSASAQSTKWRIQNYYGKSLGLIYTLQDDAMSAIGKMTDGKFVCQLFQANELVPVPGMVNAVSSGTIEGACTLSSFYVGINKAFAFGTGLPFGMNARLHYAWLRFGGGNEILDKELYRQYGIVHLPTTNSGAQMGGWFRKEIKSVADLKGLKMRIQGLGGEVMSSMGVLTQQIAPSDVYASIEKGVIDAAEFGGPASDEKTNLQKVAKYYYTQGFWDYGAQLGYFVNRERWEKLPEGHREAFLASLSRFTVDGLAHPDAYNMPALERIIASGTQVRTFPADVLKKGYEASFDLYETEANRNPTFKAAYQSFMKFRDSAYRWWNLCEAPLDVFVGNAIARSRRK